MKFLKKLGDAISKPVRGIGRILRGNVREGLSDIGSTAKLAAPILAATGVGAPIAMGIGALGGALSSKRGSGIGGVLRGAAGGAATAGAGALAHGALAGQAAGALPDVAKVGGIGSRLLGGAKDLAKWAGPEVIADVLGTGAQAYGAHQMGQAEDRMASLDEEAIRRRFEDEDRRRRVASEIMAERGWR